MIDSAPSLAERGKYKPVDLQEYARRETKLRKLPQTQIIKEGDKEYYAFLFNNGFKVITDTFEESVRFTEDPQDYFRIRKFLVNFQGRDVDLLDNEFAQPQQCDHYISFRSSTIGSHFNRQAIVIDNQNQEIERRKSYIVLYVPINKDGTDYDGEQMLYDWIHELGHAFDLVDLARIYRKVDNNGSTHYDLISYDRVDDIRAERNAHAVGIRILRAIRKLYGNQPHISEKRYIHDLAEPSLHARQGKTKGFRTAYSDEDRALFRKEEMQIKKEADVKNYENSN